MQNPSHGYENDPPRALRMIFYQICARIESEDESLTQGSDLFSSRHVVQSISLYTDRNPLNIHHQLGHNKFDALRNTAAIKA